MFSNYRLVSTIAAFVLVNLCGCKNDCRAPSEPHTTSTQNREAVAVLDPTQEVLNRLEASPNHVINAEYGSISQEISHIPGHPHSIVLKTIIQDGVDYPMYYVDTRGRGHLDKVIWDRPVTTVVTNHRGEVRLVESTRDTLEHPADQDLKEDYRRFLTMLDHH